MSYTGLELEHFSGHGRELFFPCHCLHQCAALSKNSFTPVGKSLDVVDRAHASVLSPLPCFWWLPPLSSVFCWRFYWTVIPHLGEEHGLPVRSHGWLPFLKLRAYHENGCLFCGLYLNLCMLRATGYCYTCIPDRKCISFQRLPPLCCRVELSGSRAGSS